MHVCVCDGGYGCICACVFGNIFFNGRGWKKGKETGLRVKMRVLGEGEGRLEQKGLWQGYIFYAIF